MNDYKELREAVARWEAARKGTDPKEQRAAFDEYRLKSWPVDIAQLLADLDAARADAARYQYLKDRHIDYLPAGYNGCEQGRHDMLWYTPTDDLDAAIDAAMKGDK